MIAISPSSSEPRPDRGSDGFPACSTRTLERFRAALLTGTAAMLAFPPTYRPVLPTPPAPREV